MLAICLLLCYTPPHVCCIHEGDASDLLMLPLCKGILLDSRLIPFTKYIWWKTPEEALRYPNRLIARVMDRGSWEDVCALIDTVGKEKLLDVLRHAEAGEFEPRSWSYWHYRLTNIGLGEVPPMPERKFE